MTINDAVQASQAYQPGEILLSVNGLCVDFFQNGKSFRAVNNLSFDLAKQKTLAIVGESGSGKSVSSLAIMGLIGHVGGKVTAGEVRFKSKQHPHPVNLLQLNEQQLRHVRGNEIAMIFQEPMTSLNPVFTVGAQIVETLRLHQAISANEAKAKALELIELVRLPNPRRIFKSYPHELSGGQRQRIMIAIALSCRPQILIADEPTTALDVTVQAQVLQIIRDLQEELGTAVIFISHDMGVVSQMADDVLIMKNSQTIEHGNKCSVFYNPSQAYTKALLAAVPRIGSMNGQNKPAYFHLPDKDGKTKDPPHRIKVPPAEAALLEVDNLTTRFAVKGGFLNRVTHEVHAVENVSFQIYPGETLALVGESGSGKSTIGKTIQHLIKPMKGKIKLYGEDLSELNKTASKVFTQYIQYVFQDPYGSLNPRKTIGTSIIEPALTHGLVKHKIEIKYRVRELLKKVGLPEDCGDRYPHEFSGGQRQRICIARALSCDPSLIIADEAVSALDVSVQAQVINLLMSLQAQQGLSYLFISHDMAVVERIAHRVAVMYLGRIVEIGSRRQIFENPQHPYTKKLMAAVPAVDPSAAPVRVDMNGEIPSVLHPVGYEPRVLNFSQINPGHYVAE